MTSGMHFDDTTTAVLREVGTERGGQQLRWGDNNDDKLNTPTDWVAYIAHHAGRWFPGGFAPYDADTLATFRRQMIKVAALGVAAAEWCDRLDINGGVNHRPDVTGSR